MLIAGGGLLNAEVFDPESETFYSLEPSGGVLGEDPEGDLMVPDCRKQLSTGRRRTGWILGALSLRLHKHRTLKAGYYTLTFVSGHGWSAHVTRLVVKLV